MFMPVHQVLKVVAALVKLIISFLSEEQNEVEGEWDGQVDDENVNSAGQEKKVISDEAAATLNKSKYDNY